MSGAAMLPCTLLSLPPVPVESALAGALVLFWFTGRRRG